MARMLRATLGWLLDFPIFYKILVANSALIIAAAVAATILTRVLKTPSVVPLSAVFGVLGVTSIALNFVILKAALLPLSSVQRAVDGVRRGNLQARAVKRLLGDPDINRLIETLNSTLDDLQRSQQARQELSQRVLSAQEEERRRIARELHDETGQALTSLLVGLKALERVENAAELQQRVAALRSMTSATLDSVHRLALELRPAALDELGLVPALRAYARDYAQQHSLKVEFHACDLAERPAPAVELALYRVVQEALTNVARHAAARRVWVSLERHNGTVTAKVEDDGRGFNPGPLQRARGRCLGLFGMQERLATVGGRLAIEGAHGAGTRIVAEAPLLGRSHER
jgi:two-component system sensor histidine kinase UhpB